MKGSEFFFDCVHLLHFKCHKINSNWSGWYIDSPDWIKTKKATINPINKNDNKYFQYPGTIALNHKNLRKNPERILKIKLFIDKHNWEGVNYPSVKDDCKKIEKNNVTIALNVLYAKNGKVSLFYVSKHNSKREKEAIFLMIPNGERWLHIAEKKTVSIIKNGDIYNNGDFYCLNCLHSFRTKNKFESHKKVYENKDFCNDVMPSEDTKILKFSQYQKSCKTPFIIYADFESFIGR